MGETFKVEIIHTSKFLSFEAICIFVKHSSVTANFICIYRPPGCAKTLFDEFPNFLENTLQFHDELYIFGDFNIHLDKPSENTRPFLDIWDTFSLHQHVTFPTHIYGHWLDVFITRSNFKHVKAVSSSDGLSDHLTVGETGASCYNFHSKSIFHKNMKARDFFGRDRVI